MGFEHRIHRRRAYNEAGHAHELTFSCHRNHKLLAAQRSCIWLAEAIERARRRLDFSLWAYVFMPNHVHLIIHPQRDAYDIREILTSIKHPVSRVAMRYLKSKQSPWLERLTVRRGTGTERRFWQTGGGYDRNIVEPRTLLSMIDYLHLNPVRRGYVEQAAQWNWSSASWFQGKIGTNSLRPDAIPSDWLDT